MTDADSRLQQAFDDLADLAPHDPDLAGTIRRQAAWRRSRLLAPIAAAVAVLLVTATILAIRSVGGGGAATAPSNTPGPPSTGGPATSACTAVEPQVLPDWARAGFTDPDPVATYVLGRRGSMAAITFGPLAAPQQPDTNNKILWVSKPVADATQSETVLATNTVDFDLHISGVLEGGTATMQTTVLLGPSIVDVPQPGCWIFELDWGSRSDTVALNYAAGSGS